MKGSEMREHLVDKRVRRLVGKAIGEYGLIEGGDRILVGVSGGKDSLTLLKVLAERKGVVPIEYELLAVSVDLGFNPLPLDELKGFADSLGVPLVVKHTQIGPKAHSPDNPEIPCFICSRWRRKVLFETAEELGCNKIALGHNKDDILVTFFLNVLFAGEISTMVPKQELFGGKLTIIRPLALLDEDRIEAFSRIHGLPVFEDGCPTKGKTKRHEVKMWLEEMFRRHPETKGNAFRALSHVNLKYLLPPINGAKGCPS